MSFRIPSYLWAEPTWCLLQSISIASLVLIAAWASLVCLYRISFHPLAKYPGPRIAKVTDLYNVYHCFVGDRHLEFHRIHQKYGNIVRYGPNRISINTVTALHTIYAHKANVDKSSHFRVFTKFFPTCSTQTIIDVERHGHKYKRRVLSQALTDRSLQKLENDVLPIIRQFCRLLRSDGVEPNSGWSPPKDMAQLAGHLSFDVMGQICFGRKFDMLENNEHRYLLGVASEGARCLNTVGHMQFLLNLGIHKIIFAKLLQGLENYKKFSLSQCRHRLDNTAEMGVGNDVFAHLIEARRSDNEELVFSKEELPSESSLLIIAGSETTATCIAATLFYLLHNREALHRSQTEVRSKFANLEDIRSGPRLNSCVFLRACIDESLRMSPPVGGLMPREVRAGGIVVDGHFFAEGTELGTPCYAIQHKEEYYPNPQSYEPSRWLATDASTADEKNSQLARQAFCAWSIGPRNCVGKAMAYLELMVVLGRVLYSFDMRLGSTLGEGSEGFGRGRTTKGEYQLWDTFASKSQGPVVRFRPACIT